MASILFLIGTYPSFGGTEKVTTFLANQFIKDGHQVAIASFAQPEPQLNDELVAGVKLLELTYPVLSGSNKGKLKNAIKDFQIDIIINQWALTFTTNILCKSAIGKHKSCKLISVFHNAPNKNARVTTIDIALAQLKKGQSLKRQSLKFKRFCMASVIRWSMHYVYKNSDQYVILSDSFKQIFMDYAMLKSIEKLTVITNPLTIAEVKWKPSEKEKLLIYVGRIDYNQKRVERVITIWEKLSKELVDWKLEIVGDGPERKKLESFAAERHIDRIYFEGFQNPLDYYKRASLLLLTSEYEGFGLVIVEGMRYGVVPLVYGSYESVYDIIEHRETGFIAEPPYNHEDFETIIRELANNEMYLKKLSKNGVRASEKYTLAETANRWYRLFNKITNK